MDRQAAADGRIGIANVVVVLLLLGAVALIGIVAGVASRLAGTGSAGASSAPVIVDTTTLPVTVPLRRDGGHLLVDVSFGPGLTSVPMLLDTGAPTMIPPGLASELGATPLGQACLAPLGGRPRDVLVVRIPELRIGGAMFSDVSALVGEPKPGSPLAELAGNGMVGTSLLAAAVWQIDYPAARLTIAADTSGLAGLGGAVTLRTGPAAAHAPSALVDLVIDGASVPTLIDTGSDVGLLVHPDVLAAAAPGRPARPASMDTLDGRRSEITWPALVAVTLGAGRAQPRLVDVTTAVPPGTAILGNAFLAGHVLTFDIPSQRIYISRV